MAKEEYDKHPTQIQEGMHPAMKKLYSHAKGARTFEFTEDLTIEGKDADPAEHEPEAEALQEGEAPGEGGGEGR